MKGIRLLVCGGRFYRDAAALGGALDAIHATDGISDVIHGDCHLGGADRLAQAWADEHGVHSERYPVDHALDGPWPGAGPRRNERMERESKPHAVLAAPGDKGTRDMVDLARKRGLPVWFVTDFMEIEQCIIQLT